MVGEREQKRELQDGEIFRVAPGEVPALTKPVTLLVLKQTIDRVLGA